MDDSDPTDLLKRAVRIGGYALLGFVGTGGLALGLLFFVQPLGPLVYDSLYLAVGPWTATEATRTLTFTGAGLIGVAGPALVAAALTAETDPLARFIGGVGVEVGGFLVLLVASAVVELISFLAAVVVAAAFVAGLLWLLRTLRIWPGPAITVGGGVPVLALLLLALGFGLGWGGGYDVVTEEIPAGSVDGPPPAAFEEAPDLRDDLLTPTDETAAYCETDGDRRTCRLPLRGYDHEVQAARFLADHGVRCPYLVAPARQPPGRQSFVATADGTAYQVSCQAYGD